MKNTIRLIFDKYGLTCREAAKKGVNYQTLWKQLHGLRPVGAKTAMRYHKILNIPLHELRPDLWPPDPSVGKTSEENLANEEEAEDCARQREEVLTDEN